MLAECLDGLLLQCTELLVERGAIVLPLLLQRPFGAVRDCVGLGGRAVNLLHLLPEGVRIEDVDQCRQLLDFLGSFADSLS